MSKFPRLSKDERSVILSAFIDYRNRLNADIRRWEGSRDQTFHESDRLRKEAWVKDLARERDLIQQLIEELPPVYPPKRRKEKR